MNINIEVMANTIEKELDKSLNMVSIQALDNAIQKAHWCLDTQRELRRVLYQRKYRAVKTYADYIGMGSKV
ncbi:hypothetical protein NGC81_01795 [Staphylococcus xylosus]|uniref:hypothetical protein n=1 Tax=Staphylococcus xylosus TaxID=1288 RepID=UPI002DBB5B13|nr:hypothetical protein [Staphylococcus xylosus]MEB7755335.1 hypothetical protein [Staphylococcus xylosus]